MTEISETKSSPREILVILMGSIGDVCRGLAVADQLKKNFPGCRLSWLVEPACQKIVSLNRHIDRVIVYQRPKGIFGIAALMRELREVKYDVVLDLQRHFKSGFFSWLSRAPLRLGFYPKNSKEFNFIFNTDYIPDLPKDEPKLSHYLSFIEKLGGQISRPLDFGLSEVKNRPENRALRDSLPERYIFYVMGSSWDSKDWPLENYAGLTEIILGSSDLKIVLLGDRSQAEFAAQLEERFKDARLINLAGKTTLAEAMTVIDLSLFGLGPDSGPGHIAAALNKRYISLFGPTDPRLTAPLNNEDLVVRRSLACMPCYKRRCPGLNRMCMRLIHPEQVFEKVRGLAQG